MQPQPQQHQIDRRTRSRTSRMAVSVQDQAQAIGERETCSDSSEAAHRNGTAAAALPGRLLTFLSPCAFGRYLRVAAD